MAEYPTKRELKHIKNAECIKYEDAVRLAQYVVMLWHFDDFAILEGKRTKKLILVTGGWSGNEEIQSALNQNFMFNRYWEMSKRGGLSIYKIKPNK